MLSRARLGTCAIQNRVRAAHKRRLTLLKSKTFRAGARADGGGSAGGYGVAVENIGDQEARQQGTTTKAIPGPWLNVQGTTARREERSRDADVDESNDASTGARARVDACETPARRRARSRRRVENTLGAPGTSGRLRAGALHGGPASGTARGLHCYARRGSPRRHMPRGRRSWSARGPNGLARAEKGCWVGDRARCPQDVDSGAARRPGRARDARGGGTDAKQWMTIRLTGSAREDDHPSPRRGCV